MSPSKTHNASTLRLEVIDKLSSLASSSSPSPSLSHFKGDDMVTMGDDVKKLSSPNEPHNIKESDDSDDNDDAFTNLSNIRLIASKRSNLGF